MPQAFTMHATSSGPPGAAPRDLTKLLPLIVATVVAYLTVGLALPVLPLRVRQGLGLGTFVVDLGNPKMRLRASGDRATFGLGLTHLGRPSPAKVWVLTEVSLRLLIRGVGSTTRATSLG